MAQMVEVKFDRAQVYDSWRGNLAGFDEDFLAELPGTFQRLTEQYSPEFCAAIFNNFGVRISEFPLGVRSLNLEIAIAAYHRSLEVRTRDGYPEKWALTQNNLGTAYSDRIRGERGENLEEAIAAYHRSLEVYTRDGYPEDWALTQNNLARAYRERERDGDLDRAISMMQEAIAVQCYGSEFSINGQFSLGNALAARYDRDNNPEDLAAAEKAYAIALDCIDPEHYDIELYRNALPSVRAIMGGRLVRDGQWKKGLELLLTSLDELKNAKDDQVYANALYQTARAYEYEDNQPKARTYYRDALRLYQRLGNTLGMARCRYGLGNVLINQGFPKKGKIELETARELYETLDKQDKIEDIDRLLSSLRQTLAQLDAYDQNTAQ